MVEALFNTFKNEFEVIFKRAIDESLADKNGYKNDPGKDKSKIETTDVAKIIHHTHDLFVEEHENEQAKLSISQAQLLKGMIFEHIKPHIMKAAGLSFR